MGGSSTGICFVAALLDGGGGSTDDALPRAGSDVLLNSNILLRASSPIQLSGGGAPLDPVASSADLRKWTMPALPLVASDDGRDHQDS